MRKVVAARAARVLVLEYMLVECSCGRFVHNLCFGSAVQSDAIDVDFWYYHLAAP